MSTSDPQTACFLIEYIAPADGVCWRHSPMAKDLLAAIALADGGLGVVRERFGAIGYQIRDRLGRVCADYFEGEGAR